LAAVVIFAFFFSARLLLFSAARFCECYLAFFDPLSYYRKRSFSSPLLDFERDILTRFFLCLLLLPAHAVVPCLRMVIALSFLIKVARKRFALYPFTIARLLFPFLFALWIPLFLFI